MERWANEGGSILPGAPAPADTAAASHYRTMFVVPFATAMSDTDLHRMATLLDMATHRHPKLQPSATTPGVRRLDPDSGLFLLRGAAEREWRLEGRTWGTPAARFVEEWRLLAGDTARLLDPEVPESYPVGARTAEAKATARPAAWWRRRPGSR